jgi:hypothetical protein
MRGKPMHFEILVEDQSGKKALENLVPKIIRCNNGGHTVRFHAYKGIGHIPKGIKSHIEADRRILLDQLPRLLNGFGRTFAGYGATYKAVAIVVCDLDNRNQQDFLKELYKLLEACQHAPETYFCLAIEEGEAWLLGDISAVKKAYPNAKEPVLQEYKNDSICGTWELLADAVYEGGAASLKSKGWIAVGAEKSQWASKITSVMDTKNNKSPSFHCFCDCLGQLATNDSAN